MSFASRWISFSLKTPFSAPTPTPSPPKVMSFLPLLVVQCLLADKNKNKTKRLKNWFSLLVLFLLCLHRKEMSTMLCHFSSPRLQVSPLSSGLCSLSQWRAWMVSLPGERARQTWVNEHGWRSPWSEFAMASPQPHLPCLERRGTSPSCLSPKVAVKFAAGFWGQRSLLGFFVVSL